MNMRLRHIAGTTFILITVVMLIYLYKYPKASEGFVDVGRCGVDMPSCQNGLRCMNGYCKSDVPPQLPPLSDLPVRPPRYPYSP